MAITPKNLSPSATVGVVLYRASTINVHKNFKSHGVPALFELCNVTSGPAIPSRSYPVYSCLSNAQVDVSTILAVPVISNVVARKEVVFWSEGSFKACANHNANDPLTLRTISLAANPNCEVGLYVQALSIPLPPDPGYRFYEKQYYDYLIAQNGFLKYTGGAIVTGGSGRGIPNIAKPGVAEAYGAIINTMCGAYLPSKLFFDEVYYTLNSVGGINQADVVNRPSDQEWSGGVNRLLDAVLNASYVGGNLRFMVWNGTLQLSNPSGVESKPFFGGSMMQHAYTNTVPAIVSRIRDSDQYSPSFRYTVLEAVTNADLTLQQASSVLCLASMYDATSGCDSFGFNTLIQEPRAPGVFGRPREYVDGDAYIPSVTQVGSVRSRQFENGTLNFNISNRVGWFDWASTTKAATSVALTSLSRIKQSAGPVTHTAAVQTVVTVDLARDTGMIGTTKSISIPFVFTSSRLREYRERRYFPNAIGVATLSMVVTHVSGTNTYDAPVTSIELPTLTRLFTPVAGASTLTLAATSTALPTLVRAVNGLATKDVTITVNVTLHIVPPVGQIDAGTSDHIGFMYDTRMVGGGGTGLAGRWFRHDGIPARLVLKLDDVDDNGALLFASALDSRFPTSVYQLDYGYLDHNLPIPWRWPTAITDLGSPHAIKQFTHVILDFENYSGGVTVYWETDGGVRTGSFVANIQTDNVWGNHTDGIRKYWNNDSGTARNGLMWAGPKTGPQTFKLPATCRGKVIRLVLSVDQPGNDPPQFNKFGFEYYKIREEYPGKART